MNKKGFTLIELLIVVAIIGILAAVGAAVIPGLLEKAKMNATIASHNSIVKYLKTQQVACSMEPNSYIKLSRANGTEYNEKCSTLFGKGQTSQARLSVLEMEPVPGSSHGKMEGRANGQESRPL
mgnify:CR=1 FL=1